jgi:hypothetical protein
VNANETLNVTLLGEEGEEEEEEEEEVLVGPGVLSSLK